MAEHSANKQKLFAAKGKGPWDLCKELGAKRTSPLIAVKRPSQGKQKQAKGTVATNPNEVDEILRDVLDKIYDGNAKEGGILMKNTSLTTIDTFSKPKGQRWHH